MNNKQATTYINPFAAVITCAVSPVFIWAGISSVRRGISGIQLTNEAAEISKRCTSTVTATADEVKREERYKSDDDGGHYETWFIARYSFEANGKKISDKYESTRRINKGQSIEVVYNSDDPYEHFTAWERDSMPLTKNASYFTIVIGAAIFIGGVVFTVKTVMRR